MNLPEPTPPNRRQFLASSVRYLSLGGLSVFVVAQELKRKRLLNDPNCIKLFTCQDCVEFSGCKLDKADTYRAENNLVSGESPSPPTQEL